jgi:hypothetical protein
MNRPFPRLEVLGLTAALAVAGACTPNTSVKPGAPVLIELSIVEFESAGPVLTTVTPMTGLCPDATAEGGACDSVAYPVCESVTTSNLCRCVPNPPPMSPPPTTDAGASDAATSDAGKPDAGAATSDAGAKSDASSDAAAPMLTGTWSCSFAPTSAVLYVFDRLLGTASLGDGGGAPNLATTTPASVVLNGDYASNGSPNEIIFPLLGDFRADGPSILFGGVPGLPTSTTITVALDKTKVLAKDGTPFTGTNLLTDGRITFATQPFGGILTAPPPPAPVGDAAAPTTVTPDMTPATVVFTNLVDPTALASHITVTAAPPPAGGSPTVAVDVASMDGLNVTIAPAMGANWPANTTITITIDATATDVVGDVLAAPVDPVSFTTSPL